MGRIWRWLKKNFKDSSSAASKNPDLPELHEYWWDDFESALRRYRP